MTAAMIAAIVAGLLIGFGAGYVVRDQTAKDRTTTVVHKKAPCVDTDILEGGCQP
jgi:hypothetical protein